MKKFWGRTMILLLTLCLFGTGALAEVSYPIETTDNELSFWLPIQPIASKYMSSYDDHRIYSIISENTGMNVEFLNCSPADAAQQLNLLIVSDDLPDLMQIRGLYSGGPAAGVSEGVFADLTPYLQEYAPDYWALLTSSDISYRLATDEEGRVFAFYYMNLPAPAYWRPNVLQEMLDEYSIEVPTTLDEYEAAFEIMKSNDIAGLHLNQNGRTNFLMWAFDIADGWGLDSEGNVQYGMYTENYKAYLTKMNEWYTKGYIYKDFMSQMSDTERWALLMNKDVFMIPDSVDLVNSVAVANGLTAAPLPFPRLTQGQSIHFLNQYDGYTPDPNFGTTVISASCENIEEAVQYMNYYFTDEGADLCNWGIKDETYVVNEDGSKSFTDKMLNNPDIPLGDVQMNLKIHMTAKRSLPDTDCNPNVVSDEAALEKRKRYSDDPTVDGAQSFPTFNFTAEASEARNDIMSDINTYIDEMTLKFITGVTSLDEYDSYMEQLKVMGIEDAVNITTQQYEAFMSKPGLE